MESVRDVRAALSASLHVDGRFVQARAMAGSGVGEASGLAVVTTTEAEVMAAASWLPGRVIVLTGSAITRRTVPVVVKGAHLATFSALVVVADDLYDLGHVGRSGLPVPVVFVDRPADHFWMLRATRISVCVTSGSDGPGAGDVVDVRPRRRRSPLAPAYPVPGTHMVPGVVPR